MVGYLESTASFAIQIVVLGLLSTALFLKINKKYRQHALLMLSAVILHLVSILVVMIPSFRAFTGGGAINYGNPLMMVTLVHVAAGLLAAVLGVFLVGSWHLKTDLKGCFRKKRVMDATLILWSLAFVLGTFLYLIIIGVI